MNGRTKADAYERGMQEGLDLRDSLREQLGDREQDLRILSKEIDRLRGEVVPRSVAEALAEALTGLREFGEQLMASDVMEERGIGACVCESTRAVDDYRAKYPRKETS